MSKDNFTNAFAEYYNSMLDVYGDTDQGMEEAYNDFEDAYSNSTVDINLEDEFVNYYTDLENVYGDTDQGLEDAYNDFMELVNGETEDDSYGDDDVDESFLNYYSELADIYGDTDQGIEDAYNDFYAEGGNGKNDQLLELPPHSETGNNNKKYRGAKIAGTAIAGGAAGYGISHLATKKWKERLAYLQSKGNKCTDTEEAEKKVLRNKILAAKAVATVAGAAGAGYVANKTFSDFYSENMELYNDIDEAVEDFYASKVTKGDFGRAFMGAGVGTGLGAGIGYLAGGKSLTPEEKLRLRQLTLLNHQGRLNSTEKKEYQHLISLKKASTEARKKSAKKGAMIGAGVGAVGGALAPSPKTFSDFYSENMELYNDIDEAVEDFYAKEETLLPGGTMITDVPTKYKKAKVAGALVAGGAAGGVISHLAIKKWRKRLEYLLSKGNKCTDAEEAEKKSLKMKILAATAAGGFVGAAGAKYIANKKFSDEEDDKTIKELRERLGYLTSKEDRTEEEEKEMNDLEMELSTIESSKENKEAVEEVADDFADFYTDNYESFSSVEDAFDSYCDVMKEVDDTYDSSFWDKAKSHAGSTVGRTAIGAGAGLLAANVFDKNKNERKQLKAKAAAGTISPNEAARLKQLQADKKKSLIVGSLGGAAVGAASKGIAGGFKSGKETFDSNEKGSKTKGVLNSFAKGFKGSYKDSENSSSDNNINGEDRNFSSLKEKNSTEPGKYVSNLILGN